MNTTKSSWSYLSRLRLINFTVAGITRYAQSTKQRTGKKSKPSLKDLISGTWSLCLYMCSTIAVMMLITLFVAVNFLLISQSTAFDAEVAKDTFVAKIKAYGFKIVE